jgi:hypothetical protein
VAVRRVLVQADVGHHQEFRDLSLEEADGFLHRSPVVPGLAARLVLLLGNAEQDDGRDAGREELPRLAEGFVGRKARDARKGRDRLLLPLPMPHEERRDETIRRKARLADERTHPGAPAQAAHADRGVRHVANLCPGGRGRKPFEEREGLEPRFLRHSIRSTPQDSKRRVNRPRTTAGVARRRAQAPLETVKSHRAAEGGRAERRERRSRISASNARAQVGTFGRRRG